MKYSDIIKEIKEPRQLFLKVLHRYPETFKWIPEIKSAVRRKAFCPDRQQHPGLP